MAAPSWMQRRHPNTRRIRITKWKKEEDLLTSCLKQEPCECFHEILDKITTKHVEETVLLNYLNTFVKVLLHYEGKLDNIGFSTKDILYCLKVALTHESTMIRSASLRCIRHTIESEEDVVLFNKLLIPFFIVRSFDLVLKNDVERIEAMKLMRKTLIISPLQFNKSMARSLVSLANEGTEGKDRMLRICLATLLEIGVLNSELFIKSGGVSAVTRNLIECQTPKIAESLCGVLLLLLDKPSSRQNAAVDLHSVAAPFCDFHYKHGWKDKNRRDERELRLNCSRLALLTILRSWPGILHFCNPSDKGGFKAIVDVLYLDQLEVRKAVLDLLYELLGLPQPEWTDEVSVALSAVDPCEPQSSWRLKEDFVVAEGRAVLPHLSKTTLCTTDMHLSLLLYCFLENGLLGALTEVIVTSDTFISVRATVLLGELLRLIQILLPPGCCNFSPALPALLEYATQSVPQAMAAVTALQQLHKLMKKRPASYSIHLDYILRNSSNKRTKRKPKSPRHKAQSGLKSKLNQVKSVLKDGEDIVKETGVLSSNDAFTWNWDLIKLLLKDKCNVKLDLTDTSHKLFIKRLIEFFMPSQNKYSHTDLGPTPLSSLDLTSSGIELINFLIKLNDPEYHLMVLELFKDILCNIVAITTSRSVHDCLFSPQHMINTHCQSYFLFIGQFARSEPGLALLKSIEMFMILKELATTTNHDCYVKLIISSLDYGVPGPSRDLLKAVLMCNVETSRLYATQFFLVLLRAGNLNFEDWAVKLLVNQLDDKSRAVYLSALSTLHEACELPECLDALIDLNPNFHRLGEKGTLLAIRLLSSKKFFKKIGKEKVVEETKRWDEHFSYRYVKLAEGDISDALTLHQRNIDGKYDKRVTNCRNSNRRDVFLPPHLYGQLNQYAEGFQVLLSTGNINNLVETIKLNLMETDDQILKLKTALWAVAHVSTSKRGFNYLNSYSIIENIIHLTITAPVYSVRATAFYSLGLISTTTFGADELSRNNWLTARHNRNENWPVIKEELQDTVYLRNYTTSISDETTYIENPLLIDFENIDEDSVNTVTSDGVERLEYYVSPTFSPGYKIKQSTLPAGTHPSEIFHQRSLSESKTFDTSNGYDEEARQIQYPFSQMVTQRQRNTSMTESTTSGVSSCDSIQTRQGAGGVNYFLTLSPIPSSSSLSTLKVPYRRKSHRVSSNSAGSEASSSSNTGSMSNELSFQNLLGYSTLRYIRKPESFDLLVEPVDYLFKPPPQTAGSRRFTLPEYSPSSSFSTQKFKSQKGIQDQDRLYMGICLPKKLIDLFPNSDESVADSHSFTQDSCVESTSNANGYGTNTEINSTFKHNTESCLFCCQVEDGCRDAENTFTDSAKVEVLKQCERLANPVMNKQVRSHLFRSKQRDPIVFKDICVYSEVCKMFSDISYRLSIRRLLHEIFYDLSYDCLYEIPRKILKKQNTLTEKDDSKKSISSTSKTISPTEFMRLDSLKLIYNENKFPIVRCRKNTN